MSFTLQLGQKAPEFNLISTSNENICISSFDYKFLVIFFTCNHCPYVKSVIGRIIEDCNLIKDKGIGIIAIMSNDVNDPKYGAEDSYENMKLFAQNNKFTFPYVYDETQNTGRT